MAIKKVTVEDLNKIEGGNLTPRKETRHENRVRTRKFLRSNSSSSTTSTGSATEGTKDAPESLEK